MLHMAVAALCHVERSFSEVKYPQRVTNRRNRSRVGVNIHGLWASSVREATPNALLLFI